ncbi:bacteriocin-like protein [Chryseobacterium paridis]|uniref:Uncharacterized protein n=1 Tax=Chryseobacterium paridis TaxID=2800328 RepID=A0ABS1FUL3_9FLAO|nr:hypothetical protein [Chryseobacterium paridis]MBK1896140.1 hypothetical protein [Chryseobacterium paridis]
MNNLKKLSREDLRNLGGGRRACSIAIQGSDGTWVTRTGSCMTLTAESPSGLQVSTSYCETGLGMINVTSNGGDSRCNS